MQQMFNLTHLALVNVGPYEGSHRLDFAHSAAGGVTLVTGGSGYGKTTIASAILFALGISWPPAQWSYPVSSHVRQDIGAVVGRVDLGIQMEASAMMSIARSVGEPSKEPPEGIGCAWLPHLGGDEPLVYAIGPTQAPVRNWGKATIEATRLYQECALSHRGSARSIQVVVSSSGAAARGAAGEDITDEFGAGDRLLLSLCALIGQLNASFSSCFLVSDGLFGRLDREHSDLALDLMLRNQVVRQILLLAHEYETQRLLPAVSRSQALARYEIRYTAASSIVPV